MWTKPDWNREGRNWPNREASRFVLASGIRWHVQVMGRGPAVLLLHGTGSATHSWRDVAPLLARDFTVIAPDLPGHGFTDTPAGDGLSLLGMARELAGLLQALGAEPVYAVGHSAGAAVALRMAIDRKLAPGGIVSLNGALRPFPGAGGHIFPAMAQLLFLNPMTPQVFAWRASHTAAVDRLIRSTGSVLDARGIELYRLLLSCPGHVAATLGMMARWDLHPLQADLSKTPVPLTLVAAGGDRAVPPKVADEVKARVPQATIVSIPRLGHLAHEEAPAQAADIIRRALSSASGGAA